jgi:hypothetical protein
MRRIPARGTGAHARAAPAAYIEPALPGRYNAEPFCPQESPVSVRARWLSVETKGNNFLII